MGLLLGKRFFDGEGLDALPGRDDEGEEVLTIG
jgi:hypothetical protein